MIITRTPFRITLGGGGTDLPSYYSQYGGFILSVGIDKYMYICLNTPLLDDCIRVRYSQNEICHHPEEVQHTLAREALKALSISRGIEIVSVADIPAGTGLGSSSCYLVGLLNAMHTYVGDPVSREALAIEACRIELEVLKKPIGKQDQYMAAFGGLTTLDIARDGTVHGRRLKVDPEILEALESNILLFYTGLSRDALKILSTQSSATARNEARVVESLHEIKEIGLAIQDAIVRGDLHQVGELFDLHWQSKKRLSNDISSTQVDAWYELAKANGAVGGKISGAGGGGFLMLYCDGDRRRLRATMGEAGLVELRFRFDLEGSKVLVNWISSDKSWQQVGGRKTINAFSAPGTV
ncbi:MAG: galactokinase [Elusimicrobia bacterium RIFCSPLOWO2_12_FULL_59_9]|nr:MAG: galactokinase [Elusimicrobia bacterium RIFCSPLOWO2_12_FULL_59_9]